MRRIASRSAVMLAPFWMRARVVSSVLEEFAPRLLRDGRILVGEIEQSHAVLAVEARDLLGEAHGIAVAPAGPEAALAAIGAEMRAPARELNDHAAQPAPIGIARMVDQLPADAIGVEIADHRCRARRPRHAGVAIGDARNRIERLAPFERRDEPPRSFFALAAHDGDDVGFRVEDLPPMIRGKHAAIDDADAGQRLCDVARNLCDDRMARGRARMSEQHRVGLGAHGVGDDVGERHRAELGVEQAHLVAVVDQRPADREESERRQVIVRDAAADRRVGDVDEDDAHGSRRR
jgi:hypothetical protein